MSATSAPQGSTRLPTESQTGWIIFAALMLALAGGFNICFGLTALLNDEILHTGGSAGVVILDFTVWGWVHLIMGVLMLFTSYGLIAMRGWARWAGIAFAALNTMVQFASITATPIAAVLMVLFDLIVIYQLTLH